MLSKILGYISSALFRPAPSFLIRPFSEISPACISAIPCRIVGIDTPLISLTLLIPPYPYDNASDARYILRCRSSNNGSIVCIRFSISRTPCN